MQSKKITLIAATITVFIFSSCHQKQAPGQRQAGRTSNKKHWVKTQTGSATGFDAFFKQFETDPAMQLAHIKFPLKLVYIGGDEGGSDKTDSVRVMQKQDWHFSGDHAKGLMVSKIYINPNEMQVLFQIEDTGVHTLYFFKRTAQTWQLQQIEDSSD